MIYEYPLNAKLLHPEDLVNYLREHIPIMRTALQQNFEFHVGDDLRHVPLDAKLADAFLNRLWHALP